MAVREVDLMLGFRLQLIWALVLIAILCSDYAPFLNHSIMLRLTYKIKSPYASMLHFTWHTISCAYHTAVWSAAALLACARIWHQLTADLSSWDWCSQNLPYNVQQTTYIHGTLHKYITTYISSSTLHTTSLQQSVPPYDLGLKIHNVIRSTK